MNRDHQLLVRQVLQLGGAWLVHQIRASRPDERLAQALAWGSIGILIADVLAGPRGTQALLEGAAVALRSMA